MTTFSKHISSRRSATTILTLILLTLLPLLSACNDDDTPSMRLDGSTRVESIRVSGHIGTIDHKERSITVNVPTGTDLSDMEVEAITLSEGAVCDYPAGTHFNALIPRSIRVTNGDAYSDYSLSVKHDDVEFLSFTLDGKYSGTIDNAARTILVFVPLEANITSMQASFTVNEGSVVNPVSGSTLDFSNPVTLTATHNSATIEYTVTVVKDSMSQAPKAFIGNASSFDGLGDEARTACRWMLDNVPNSVYVSIQDLIDGKVRIDDFTMVWCHFDWTDWPGTLWDSRDIFNGYWLRGGAILASRDGARYINDVWRISLDQQSPNNMFGGDARETLLTPLGFTITGHETHPLYEGLEADAEGRILLQNSGCSSSGRTLQWMADWDPYGSIEGWEKRTGARSLGSSHDYNPNCVTVAEFEPYEALKGFSSGRVITIGTPAYEWYDRNDADNPYRGNMITLTRNAINYLCQ